MKAHAQDYARRGLPVLPCVAHGKVPITKHGLKDATADEQTVRDWWHKWPTANVAIRTGDIFDVLDVDGEEGLDELSRLVGGDDVVVSDGPCVRTPSGGAHFYFEPTGLGNKARFAPGLDWRGAGGYVIAVPSIGANDVAYEWHVEDGVTFDLERDLVPVPGWLRELLEKPRVPNVGNGDRLSGRVAPADEGAGTRTPRFARFTQSKSATYLAHALEGEACAVAGAPVGTRNDQLNRSTHTLARLPELGANEITDVMLAAASAAGLPEREAAQTIRSALEARGVA
jgi:Bifunctional DNA primase/polymerase, N-terminal